jgi:hypothetical protein
MMKPVFIPPVDTGTVDAARRLHERALAACRQHHLVITDPAGRATVEVIREQRAAFLKDALRWRACPEAATGGLS